MRHPAAVRLLSFELREHVPGSIHAIGGNSNSNH
jgi:hypothetical protein